MVFKKGIIHIGLIVLVLAGLALIASALSFAGSRHRARQLTLRSSSNNTRYTMKVLVLKYFPLKADGVGLAVPQIDKVPDSYNSAKTYVESLNSNLLSALEKSTTYLGYKSVTATPSLVYTVVDTKEYTIKIPQKVTPGVYETVDYKGIMINNNICDYVNNQGVSEVWIWAYDGLNIAESKMAGPHGDISNSFRNNPMPVCNKTYRVYTFNYQVGTSEALESWSHQVESEMRAVDTDLFLKFQGPSHPQDLGVNGRCGSAHNPPNARHEYDRDNPTPQKSDCLDWNPDGLGRLSDISCLNWGCGFVSDGDNSSLNYMIWNWQNMPGANNTKRFNGQKLRNWWDVHADFDNVMQNSKRLTIGAETTSRPSPTPSPTATPSASLSVVQRASDTFAFNWPSVLPYYSRL